MTHADDFARIFIALCPDSAVREQLRAWRDSRAWPKPAAPVRTERLHLTLHFLGDIPRVRLPELAQGLGVGFAPFELGLGHVELWHGGIAVLAPNLAPPPLLALHSTLGAALKRLGLPIEARPYRPHVTLARRAGRAMESIQGPPVNWQVDGYALMESKLGVGAQYELVRHYPATIE